MARSTGYFGSAGNSGRLHCKSRYDTLSWKHRNWSSPGTGLYQSMLPKVQGVHSQKCSQHSAHYLCGRAFGSQRPRGRCSPQHAEPGDLQLIEKPILRRPEPPKPASEVEQKPNIQTSSPRVPPENGRPQGQRGKALPNSTMRITCIRDLSYP